jgi:uncharacterized protein YjiS (DUF1127 family)
MTNTATTRTVRLATPATAPRPGLLARLRHALEMRRALREVRELDDRMLADIGISRGELERAVRGGR